MFRSGAAGEVDVVGGRVSEWDSPKMISKTNCCWRGA